MYVTQCYVTFEPYNINKIVIIHSPDRHLIGIKLRMITL